MKIKILAELVLQDSFLVYSVIFTFELNKYFAEHTCQVILKKNRYLAYNKLTTLNFWFSIKFAYICITFK